MRFRRLSRYLGVLHSSCGNRNFSAIRKSSNQVAWLLIPTKQLLTSWFVQYPTLGAPDLIYFKQWSNKETPVNGTLCIIALKSDVFHYRFYISVILVLRGSFSLHYHYAL